MKDKSKDLKFKEIYIPKCLYFYDFNQESTQTQKEKEELISIIVPVYNELYYTKQILEDINKKIKNKYEVILIDNGSTDGTKEWVESINMK
jgi:cellulose synthase/poly-beta-1,6-N-acetylglucosamine synthase-like glycosyltransferase